LLGPPVAGCSQKCESDPGLDSGAPFEAQIGVKERGGGGDLIGRVVTWMLFVVLVHVPIQHFDGVGIGGISGSPAVGGDLG